MAIKFLNTVAVDENVLFVDTINDRVGIGTASPESNLEISDSTQATGATLSITNAHNGSWVTGDKIGSIDFRIDDPSTTQPVRAKIHTEGKTTGTYPSSSQLVFSTANVNTLYERMRIDSAGNVGIGTDSPSASLDVVGSGLSTMLRLSNTEANATIKYGAILGRHYTNAEENVTGMLITSSSNALTGQTVSIGGGISSANAVNEIIFYTAANNTTLTGSERMRITSGGNVGIGTISPLVELEVDGSIMASGTSGGSFRLNSNTISGVNNSIISTSQNRSSPPQGGISWKAGQYGGASRWDTRLHNAPYTTSYINLPHSSVGGNFVVNIESADRLTIDRTNGNVGIGTTTPTADLHVQGLNSTDVPIIRSGGFGNSGSKLELAETLNSGDMNYGFSFFNDGNSSNTLMIKAHNNSTTGTTAITIGRTDALTTFSTVPIVGTRTAGDSSTYAASTAFVAAAVVAATTAPAAPTTVTTAVVGETIEVTFNESATSNIDYYQVWSAEPGGSFGIIAQIASSEFATTMTVVDSSFNVSGTMSYRVYAVKLGIYSTAATSTQAFLAAALAVTAMTVVNLNTAYYIQYEKPSSRFIDNIEIYMDSQATLAALNRSNASIVYSGQNASYMRSVGTSNNFHQFWVEVTTT